MKLVFIEEAARISQKQTGRVNISRLSIMTGIHRKDIERLYRDEEVREAPKSLAARIVVEWQTNRKFSSSRGQPKALSLTDERSGFRALVQKVSAELNPATVLYELERVHAVQRQGETVRLVKQSYVPEGDIAKGFSLLGADMDDLMVAVEQNVIERRNSEIPNLHVKSEFDRVSVDAMLEIREWLLENGSALQRRFQEFVARFDCDHNDALEKSRCTARVALGTFALTELDPNKEEEAVS